MAQYAADADVFDGCGHCDGRRACSVVADLDCIVYYLRRKRQTPHSVKTPHGMPPEQHGFRRANAVVFSRTPVRHPREARRGAPQAYSV
jgi:hypothetical protein